MTASAIKNLAERTAALAGFDLTAKWRVPSLPMAKKMAELFRHFGITGAVDIGANEGQFRNFLRYEVGFTGSIYSFEPDPELSSALTARAKSHDPRWKIFPYALGPTAGTRSFHRMDYSVFNSFLEPNQDQPAHVRGMNTIVSTFPVEMRTLDQMAQEVGDLSRTYIKIDTQGFDLEVLEGGRNTIRSVPALQTEVSFHAVYDGSPSFSQSLSAFQAEGFAVADLFLISTDEDMRAVEFDCIMVRARNSGSAPTGPEASRPDAG